MPSFDQQDLSVQYLDTGQGEPVVLLHAGGSSGKQWEKARARFPDGYRILAPDLIGFGQTGAWPGPGELTHDHQADVVLSLVERHCESPVHLVGHSYGGSTAVRFALAFPERVRSLVLIEPNVVPLLADAGENELFDEYVRFATAFIDDVSSGRREVAWKAFIDLRNGDGTWDAMSDDRRARMLKQTDQTVDAFLSNMNNRTTIADCRMIDVRTLVICGAETTRPERKITEILADSLADCRYEVVAGAGHMSPLTHASDVAALVLDHIVNRTEHLPRCA